MFANYVAIVQNGKLRSLTVTLEAASEANLAAALVRANNVAILRRGYDEAFNNRNLTILEEDIAPNAIDHGTPELTGVDAFSMPISSLLEAFPDLQVTPELVVADENYVMALATFTGTHEVEFLGIPPTGKEVTWSHVDINRIEDGKVVEAWHIGTGAMVEALQAAAAE